MQENSSEYYQWTRREILPLLPEKMDKVLEIGCGEGQTLAWVRSVKQCKWIGGVELFPEAAARALKRLDACYVGNIETIKIPVKKDSLDAILCLDVLEHLADPWKIVRYLHTLLKPGGALISSIPNVQHYSVSFPYLFKGRWDYAAAGILDKTHLRFFVKETAVDLMESSGLKVDIVMDTLTRKKIKLIVMKLMPRYFKRFFEYQYFIRAVKK